MSGLEDLRALAAEEETPEIEPTVEVEPETLEAEPEETDEPIEADETEEVDEIDLELDDEPQVTKPTTEQALVYKLTREKKKGKEYKKSAEAELEQLRAENEALKAGNQPQPVQQPIPVAPQHGLPPVPVLYENGINTPAEYQQAYAKWMGDVTAVQNAQAQHAQQNVQAEQATAARAQRLAERSAEFITANKIKPDLATNTIQAGVQGLDEVLGVQGAALDLLDNIGNGSDKLAYYLGKNPDALATAKKLYEDDPRGFKVNTWLTKTAGKLNRRNTKISNAPAPDEALKGDGSSASATVLQKQYDNEKDLTKMRQIHKKAKAMGITLV